jgi:hypothetical protein
MLDHVFSIMFENLMMQISLNPDAFGVWIPLATGLGIGLVYALISAARKAR